MRTPIISLIFGILLQTLPVAALDPGDVNGDTRLTLDDAMLIKNHLLEKTALEGEEWSRADANQDNKVTMADVVYVTTHLYKPEEVTVMLPGDVPLVMVKIPAGSFQMSSPYTERGRSSTEISMHTVNIRYDYYMGKYELRQRQWLAVMGSWPSWPPSSTYGVGSNYPAYNISWDDCQNFITALNNHISSTEQGPANFRLPSEAEWEYACRAGTQTRFFFGDSLSVNDLAAGDEPSADGPAETLPGNRSDYAWFKYNSQGNANGTYGAHLVGTKLPNQFGLYDMTGNVHEWCQDYWHEMYFGAPTDGSAWLFPKSLYRVHRGGSWESYIISCRSANRGHATPVSRYNNYGARLAWTH